ncbi:MAG: HIT family protein [Geodermatophilaceae bacterium]|nr:HIT family protein [Geodermatophilaceae bacterium]
MRGEIPAATVHEDDEAIVFLDINQAIKAHLLIVPRVHAAQWHELDDGTMAHVARLTAQWAPAVVAAVDADGYNLLLNNGEAAGQEVMHVHFHLIPRKRGDGVRMAGVKPRLADAEELRGTASVIKAAQRARE